MKLKLIIPLFYLLVFSITFISASSFGYDNPKLPKINPPIVASTTTSGGGNFTQAIADTLYASIIWGYNQSSGTVGTFNATYNIWAYNQTTITLNMGTDVTGITDNNTVLFVDGTKHVATSQFFKYQNAQLNLTQVNGFTPLLVNGNATISGNLSVDKNIFAGGILVNSWLYNQTGNFAYNQTYSGSTFNATYNALNSTYGKFWYNQTGNFNYNQTYSGSTFNATYDALNSTYGKFWYNQTGNFNYNQTYSGSTFNSTYNTFAYNQTGNFNYNQTLAANTTVYNAYNSLWSSTFNASYDSYNSTYGKFWYNMSMTTFNATYDALNSTYGKYWYNQTNAGGWNVSGTNIFPNNLASNVGIGTKTPQNLLNVLGNGNITGLFYANSIFLVNSTNVVIANPPTTSGILELGGSQIGDVTGISVELPNAVNSPAMIFRTNATGQGKIFQGSVVGDSFARVSFEVDATGAGGNGKTGFFLGPGGSTARDTNLYRGGAKLLKTDGGFIAVGDINASNEVWVKNGTAVSPWLYNQTTASGWNVSGTNLFPNNLASNVGIGTKTPQNLLNVLGDINATNTIYTGNDVVVGDDLFVPSSIGRVGIGTLNPNSTLDVASNTTDDLIKLSYQKNGSITFANFDSHLGLAKIRAENQVLSTDLVFYPSVLGILGESLRVAQGAITVTPDLTLNSHVLCGSQNAPSIRALSGANTTGNAVISVNGCDNAGTINLTTGTTTTGGLSTTILQITFTKNYTTTPFVILTSSSVASSIFTSIYVPADKTHFNITDGAISGLSTGTNYKWNYHVVG